ncbi:unnamed protein product [Onchocerca flexuosa]|uniref:Cytochrome P450 n=1 Tax=Onchocerca flexuosa TaxID=387005 RepID=A0A183HP11_9BILA|nr:unnamed protein product [Onchocerca flexuosa]
MHTDTILYSVGVIFDTWSLHYDHEIWGNDVKQFRPNRFLNCTTIQRKNWMPFGAGPRQCIGMRFAILETKIIMCRLLKKFRFRKIENKSEIQVSLREMGTVWPDFAQVILEKRLGEYFFLI